MNENTLKLKSGISLPTFEEKHRDDAVDILKYRYKVPLDELKKAFRRIFERIGSSKKLGAAKRQEVIWELFHKFAKVESKALKRSMDNNFGLTEGSFKELCTKLKEGDETIFELIFLKHFDDCVQFLKRKYKIDHTTAYDVSMDTILEFRQKLIQEKIKYGNLRFLFTSMAGQIYLKTIRSRKNDENLTSLFESENLEDDFIILEKALSDLGEGCQKLLKQNIYDGLELKEIAFLYGKTAAAIRKQKERCVGRLKLLFAKQIRSAS